MKKYVVLGILLASVLGGYLGQEDRRVSQFIPPSPTLMKSAEFMPPSPSAPIYNAG